MNKYAYSIFADDVRAEVGNKNSIMGIYTRIVNVESIPTKINRFSIVTYLCTSLSEKFKKVSIRFTLGDSALQEEVVPEEYIANFWNDQENAVKQGEIVPDDVVSMIMSIIISPLVVDKPSVLKVNLNVDGNNIDAGKIMITGPSDQTQE